jgi:hypothetical protein
MKKREKQAALLHQLRSSDFILLHKGGTPDFIISLNNKIKTLPLRQVFSTKSVFTDGRNRIRGEIAYAMKSALRAG